MVKEEKNKYKFYREERATALKGAGKLLDSNNPYQVLNAGSIYATYGDKERAEIAFNKLESTEGWTDRPGIKEGLAKLRKALHSMVGSK